MQTQHPDHEVADASDPHAEIHLPDPSPWPLICGLAAVILGAALIWWARDTGSDFTGPAVGAAAVFALFAVGGWATEDSRMRRKAESRELHSEREARYTQVVTFAIPEGELGAAQAGDGILTTLDRADSALRGLAGFQDLRLIVSPADAGPSQVLVETTWSGRDELATYDETRLTILDLLNRRPEQVLPGSIQVFDMQVLRDTKDVSVRFGLGAAATIFGALVLGGFMVGAGLTAFDEPESQATGGNGTPGGPTTTPGNGAFNGTIAARNIQFRPTSFTVPPNTQVTLTMDNQEAVPHNIVFFNAAEPGGAPLGGCTSGCEGTTVETAVQTGPVKQTFTFTTPGPGSYAFHCAVHPTMRGSMTVQEGAPAPGQPAAGPTPGGSAAPTPGGSPAAGGETLAALDIRFDKTTLNARAGQPFEVTVTNRGVQPHNVAFYDRKGGTAIAGAQGNILSGGESEPLRFTAPATSGTYYFQCDVHPDQMSGQFVVS
jgi:plastocyanin